MEKDVKLCPNHSKEGLFYHKYHLLTDTCLEFIVQVSYSVLCHVHFPNCSKLYWFLNYEPFCVLLLPTVGYVLPVIGTNLGLYISAQT